MRRGSIAKEVLSADTYGKTAPHHRPLEVDRPIPGLQKAQLRNVARLVEQVKVDEGEILISEGQFGKECFFILSGTAEVTQRGRPVNTLGPGDFFGELATLNRGRRNATVRALCNLDLLVIGQREFNAILEISGFRDALLTSMASRIQTIDSQLAMALDG